MINKMDQFKRSFKVALEKKAKLEEEQRVK